ncbi:MAG TPA: response regulator [Roseiflexaceae bacterium]|jgi:CheY-like chemotaxis protein
MHDNSLILIVEDNPELGARLTRDVRRYGGAEAAELVQEYDEAIARLLNEPAPHAVVMEYRMRAHTGVDLALWMAAQPRLADTHRVLYTATPRALVAQNPALAGHSLDMLFALVVPKGAGSGPRVLAAALSTLPRQVAAGEED